MSSDEAASYNAVAVAFLAGVASSSLIWHFMSGKKDKKYNERELDVNASMTSITGFIETDKNRVGELPKKPRKIRWPWEELNRSVSSWAAGEEEDDESSEVSTDMHDNGAATVERSSPRDVDEEKKSDLCIGSIFGLDVGGTLAKLVYFEQGNLENPQQTSFRREQHYHQAASASKVLEARRAARSSSVGSLWEVRQSLSKERQSSMVHTSESEEDLKPLYQMRQESVPDNLEKYAETCNIQKCDVTSAGSVRNIVLGLSIDDDDSHEDEKEEKKIANEQHHSEQRQPDLSADREQLQIRRCKSMFDLSKSRDHAEALDRFYNFARRLDTYETGVKDKHLSFFSRELGGEFHFIRFETRRMEMAMDLIRVNNLHLHIHEMGATGGGAHKYAADWQRNLGIEMVKQEELDSLVAGMQFVLATVVGECYTFRPKIRRNFKRQEATSDVNLEDNTSRVSSASSATSVNSSIGSSESSERKKDQSRVDEWWWSRKVQRDVIMGADTYPYLLVTIGTGVSILRVDGPRNHERISGSTIGGGTYWGLIRLLTDVDDFESVMKLAEKGDPSKVDMMVGDIYGHNSSALEKIGLPSNLVASSFGKLVAKQDPALGIQQEDLARALLLMVTNNIGQVAYLNAQLHNTPRIYFVGNFLRHNQISQQRLSYAIDYWSKGEMEALFLEHEGYFGALGAFLLNQGISHGEQGFFQWEGQENDAAGALDPVSMSRHRRRQTLFGEKAEMRSQSPTIRIHPKSTRPLSSD